MRYGHSFLLFVLMVALASFVGCPSQPQQGPPDGNLYDDTGLIDRVPDQPPAATLDAGWTLRGIMPVQETPSEGGWVARFFRQESYLCGVKGAQTFVVLNPPNTTWDDSLPLWMSLHGGGLGAFSKEGKYIPERLSQSKLMDEESAELLLRRFVDGAGPEDFDKKASSWPPKVGLQALVVNSQKFRILLPSMCDNDVYSGVGDIDRYNPNRPNGVTPRVDGLLATRAALAYVQQHYPTTKLFLRGCSAGSVGVLTLTHRLMREGTPLHGTIADSAVISPYWQTIYDLGQQGNDCFSWHVADPKLHQERVGAYVAEPNLLEHHLEKLKSPLYLIWSTADPLFCGPPHTAKVFERLHKAIQQHNPAGVSVAREVCTDANCSVHCPTNTDTPINKELFQWVEERLAAP